VVSFVAIYRGRNPQSAELVAVSSDRRLVSMVADQMLAADTAPNAARDAVVSSVRNGRREALKLLSTDGAP
jgi:hypothetical protein